tara:strand:- start:102 stop:1187 length:1086 start_codon:yes stop_codon:yes gene_type:complete
MTYKETLFFVAKCLTISLDDKNRIAVQKQLQSDMIEWDAVVKVSTSHYVFPALYCNLKRVDFLKYLPKDLLDYMEHITHLNRDRNLQIIEQAKEINKLLLANDITPVFLKGTGNLLEGLYDDIAERMVGDIDFIVSIVDYSKTIQLLKSYNYTKYSDGFSDFRHYPRLIKENKIAAVEVHKELLLKKYTHEFNFNIVHKEIQKINGINLLSFEHQFAISIIAKQINDYGLYYKDIALRNGYDVFILSKKINGKEAISKFNTLKYPLNWFLASCYIAFGNIDSLEYELSEETEKYLYTFNDLLIDDRKRNSRKKIDNKLFIKDRMSIIYKSIFKKEYRVWLFKRISDRNWQKEKLAQLGLKK